MKKHTHTRTVILNIESLIFANIKFLKLLRLCSSFQAFGHLWPSLGGMIVATMSRNR